MKITPLVLIVLALPLLGAPNTAAATSPATNQTQPKRPAGYDDQAALNFSQNAIGRMLADYRLYDSNGQAVHLADYRGKPVVISLIYTSCYHICPSTTRHLAKVADKARGILGEDKFNIVTIGFDTPVDTPEAMRHFAQQQGINDTSWKFLSTDAATIDHLSKDLGFIFFPTAKGFDHLIQASVVDADGRVYRQVYGMNFKTPHLIDPLMELVLGKQPRQTLLADLWDKVKLFCTTYDASSDNYRFDYSLFIGMLIGFVIIVSVATILVREARRSRRI